MCITYVGTREIPGGTSCFTSALKPLIYVEIWNETLAAISQCRYRSEKGQGKSPFSAAFDGDEKMSE
jgi:hypothetical protein